MTRDQQIAAARKYMKHDPLCAAVGGYEHGCTCGMQEAAEGLDAIIASVPAEQPEAAQDERERFEAEMRRLSSDEPDWQSATAAWAWAAWQAAKRDARHDAALQALVDQGQAMGEYGDALTQVQDSALQTLIDRAKAAQGDQRKKWRELDYSFNAERAGLHTFHVDAFDAGLELAADWHLLVIWLGSMFDFDTIGSVDEIAKSAADRLAARQAQPLSDQNARFAIEGAIEYGKRGINPPPTSDHWLMQFWEIGKQLAAPQARELTDAERLDFITKAPSSRHVQWMQKPGKPVRYRMIEDGEPWGKWHSSARAAIDEALLSASKGEK